MQLPDAKYGEQKDFQEIQSGAPMSAPSMGNGGGLPSLTAPTPLSAPSNRTGEPVTSGAAMGAGPGPDALNIPSDSRESLRRMYGPILPALIAESQSRFATQQQKDAVAALIAIM
jgi:hypothetical protein